MDGRILGIPGAKRADRPGHRGWKACVLAGIAVLAGGCDADQGPGTPRLRGDRAFARGDYEDALAEYRLSMRREPGIGATLRAAHTYAMLGRMDEARTLYDEAVSEDSVHADQAVSDFVSRAREAFAAGDRYGGVSAMETAAHFRPGIVVEDLVLPMARHYSNSGEHGRAQPLYLRALGSHRRDPDVIFETALAHLEIGDCERALDFFDDFAELAQRRERETRWHVGSCALLLARELIARDSFDAALALVLAERGRVDTVEVGQGAMGAPPEVTTSPPPATVATSTAAADPGAESAELVQRVLGYLDLVLELEEPRATLPEAYFEKADILARLGDCEAAVDAYRMVPMVDVSGSAALVRQARRRVDEIRFGDGEGPC